MFHEDHICIYTTWTGKHVKNVRKHATVAQNFQYYQGNVWLVSINTYENKDNNQD